jgi:hypothetical protein
LFSGNDLQILVKNAFDMVDKNIGVRTVLRAESSGTVTVVIANSDGCALPAVIVSVGRQVVHTTSDSLFGFNDGLSKATPFAS